MSLDPGFDALLQRVQHAEHTLSVNAQHTRQRWRQLRQSWRAAWTPGRIVIVGLAFGLVAGRMQPQRLTAGASALLGALRLFAPLLQTLRAAAAPPSEPPAS